MNKKLGQSSPDILQPKFWEFWLVKNHVTTSMCLSLFGDFIGSASKCSSLGYQVMDGTLDQLIYWLPIKLSEDDPGLAIAGAAG